MSIVPRPVSLLGLPNWYNMLDFDPIQEEDDLHSRPSHYIHKLQLSLCNLDDFLDKSSADLVLDFLDSVPRVSSFSKPIFPVV
jgi:hypothetical protein